MIQSYDVIKKYQIVYLPKTISFEKKTSMKQLDVVVSPPAFLYNPYLTLNNIKYIMKDRLLNAFSFDLVTLTFDIDYDLWPWNTWPLTLTLVTFDL